MTDEDMWRKRFLLFTLVRLFGLAVLVLGLVITFSDLLRPGGWPLVGGILAVVGVIDAVLAPRILKRAWERQGRQ